MPPSRSVRSDMLLLLGRRLTVASRTTTQNCWISQKPTAQVFCRVHIHAFPSRSFQTTARSKAAAVAKPGAAAASSAATNLPKKDARHAAKKLLSGAATPAAALSFAERLAAKGTPTILYEAPSHLWMRVSTFSTSAFCAMYAAYHYWDVLLHTSEGLAWYVPHLYGIICVFMGGMSAYWIIGLRGVIATIKAVPRTLQAGEASAGAGRARVGARAGQGVVGTITGRSPIMIEVATRRLAPFLPLRRRLLAPDEVVLPFRLHGFLSDLAAGSAAGKSGSAGSNSVREKVAELERREAARRYTREHILTAPFRDAVRVIRPVFTGIRRAFTQQGFIRIKVQGAEHKLDAYGWALDRGRAMDVLLPVRSTR